MNASLQEGLNKVGKADYILLYIERDILYLNVDI